jgi:hypothetical protein
MRAVIEPHPDRHDLALEDFEYANCGAAKNKVISLKSRAPPRELAA